MDTDNETSEALMGLIRFGYNEACEELMEYIEWYISTTQGQNHVDIGPLREKLGRMVETKKQLNWEKLKQELGYEETKENTNKGS